MEQIKPKKYNIVQNIIYLAKESWGYDKRIILFSVISIVITIILAMLEIYLPKVAVDLLVQRAHIREITAGLAGIVGGMLLLQAVNGYLQSAKYFFYNDMRNVFTQRIFLTSIDCQYSFAESGESIQKYRRALNTVDQGDSGSTSRFYEIVPQFIVCISCFFLYTGILSTLHIVVVFLLLLSSVITYWFQKKETECYERTKEEYAEINKKLYYTMGQCGDGKTGKDLRVYHMKNWMTGLIRKWQGKSEKVKTVRRMQEYKTHIANCLLNFVRDGLAYAYLIAQTIQGEISVGDFMLYFGAIVGFSNWILQMVRQIGGLKTANVGINDLRDFLSIAAEDAETGECEMPNTSRGVEIEFDHVSFSYPNSSESTINDLSFHIRKGEHIALVGLNGAGKTTLIKLMTGFYEPTEGQIRINGTDMRKLRKKDVYSLFSAVFQDTLILPFMLDENIALKPKKEIDAGRVEEVLKESGLWEELKSRGITKDTYMSKHLTHEGIFLSGGQEQKLLLARALYKEAPVLLLDEPTAALDPLAEKNIYEKYEELCGNRTALFISHRLASTQFSDRIFFMKDGTIAECGSHNELISQNGEYARLFEMQSYYYNLTEEERGAEYECCE